MRKDYEYVDKATSLCLATTKKADALLDEDARSKVEWFETNPDNPRMDLFSALQSEYFVLLSNGGMLEEWYREYRKQYKETYNTTTPTDWEVFKNCFVEGYITIEKVIWDD